MLGMKAYAPQAQNPSADTAAILPKIGQAFTHPETLLQGTAVPAAPVAAPTTETVVWEEGSGLPPLPSVAVAPEATGAVTPPTVPGSPTVTLPIPTPIAEIAVAPLPTPPAAPLAPASNVAKAPLPEAPLKEVKSKEVYNVANATATTTVPTSDAVPGLPALPSLTITEEKESKPVVTTLAPAPVVAQPKAAKQDDAFTATLSFDSAGSPKKDDKTAKDKDTKAVPAPVVPVIAPALPVATEPAKDAAKSAVAETKTAPVAETAKSAAEETKKAEAKAPASVEEAKKSTAETKAKPEEKAPKEAKKEKSAKEAEHNTLTAADLNEGLDATDKRAASTEELMEELDLEVPEIRRLVRNLNEEAEAGGDVPANVSAQKGDPLASRYPKEPYEPNAPRPAFKYRTDVRPSAIYKKEYSYENKHLSPATYQGDYDKQFFGAVMDGNLTALRALLPRINSINMQDSEGLTPLHHAARVGDINSVRFLLAQKADPNAQDFSGVTALHIAAINDRPDIIHALRSNGASTRVANKEGKPPLLFALERRLYTIAPMLMGPDFDVNGRLKSGDTYLTSAVKAGDSYQASFLLDYRANPNVSDAEGYTPLMYAAHRGDNMLVNVLIGRGADTRRFDTYGRKAADIAKLAGNIELARYLAGIESSQKTPSVGSPVDSEEDLLPHHREEPGLEDEGDKHTQLLPQPTYRIVRTASTFHASYEVADVANPAMETTTEPAVPEETKPSEKTSSSDVKTTDQTAPAAAKDATVGTDNTDTKKEGEKVSPEAASKDPKATDAAPKTEESTKPEEVKKLETETEENKDAKPEGKAQTPEATPKEPATDTEVKTPDAAEKPGVKDDKNKSVKQTSATKEAEDKKAKEAVRAHQVTVPSVAEPRITRPVAPTAPKMTVETKTIEKLPSITNSRSKTE
jgi:hypothetical protein